MPKPEISRRCKSCGASVPRRASFCPECGVSVSGPFRGSYEGDGDGPSNDATRPVKDPKKPGSEQTRKSRPDREATKFTGQSGNASTLFGGGYESGKRGRVKDAKEAVKENILPRVGRIKSVSHDVLDEAAVDPSFRFLLVAAVLFLLFILLLIFSHILH